MSLIEILGIIFISIFVLTAILTLLSMPGWITIDEYYKRKLFYALILELVAAIVSLIPIVPWNGRGNEPFRIIPESSEWVAMSLDSGKLIYPVIKTGSAEFPLGTKPKRAEKNLKGNFYKGELRGSEGLILRNQFNEYVGSMTIKELERIQLFNSIESTKDEIAGRYLMRISKFSKKGDEWIGTDTQLGNSPFSIHMSTSYNGPKYEIRKDSMIIFSTDMEGMNRPFDQGNRVLHFYRHENSFYLIRVLEAKMIDQDAFVNFLQIRLNPIIEW